MLVNAAKANDPQAQTSPRPGAELGEPGGVRGVCSAIPACTRVGLGTCSLSASYLTVNPPHGTTDELAALELRDRR